VLGNYEAESDCPTSIVSSISYSSRLHLQVRVDRITIVDITETDEVSINQTKRGTAGYHSILVFLVKNYNKTILEL
jgi:hypothetical protein